MRKKIWKPHSYLLDHGAWFGVHTLPRQCWLTPCQDELLAGSKHVSVFASLTDLVLFIYGTKVHPGVSIQPVYLHKES